MQAARFDGHITVADATFHVRAGEIYGIAGVGGNGQTELVEALTGVRPPLAGSVEYKAPEMQPELRRNGCVISASHASQPTVSDMDWPEVCR